MTDRVELYYLPISHYCVSAERMLAFKGVRPKLTYAAYHDRQELLRRTGQDYVPTLMWNGKAVDWVRIPEFLDQVRPNPPLLPTGLEGVARTLENWGHEVLEARVWPAVVTKMPARLRSKEEAWVFEEMQTRSRGPWRVLEGRRREFIRGLEEYFELLEAMVRGKEWILGPPSLADFGIYGGLSPWMAAGEKIPARYPHLRAWAARVERVGGSPRRTAGR
jgi:glutathione S-transferase